MLHIDTAYGTTSVRLDRDADGLAARPAPEAPDAGRAHSPRTFGRGA